MSRGLGRATAILNLKILRVFYHEQARTFTTILHCNLQISFEGFEGGMTNLTLKDEVLRSPEVLHSGFNTVRSEVLNPSARIMISNNTFVSYLRYVVRVVRGTILRSQPVKLKIAQLFGKFMVNPSVWWYIITDNSCIKESFVRQKIVQLSRIAGFLLLVSALVCTACTSDPDDAEGAKTPVAGDFTMKGLGNVPVGSSQEVVIQPKTGKTTGSITIYYEGTDGKDYPKSNIAPTAIGKYTVTFNVGAASGWKAADGLSAGILAIHGGNIITYHPTYRATLANGQLDRLTHLVLFSVTPGTGGTIPMPIAMSGWGTESGIKDLVSRAKARNVRVILALGGWGKTGSFPESVRTAEARQNFVDNIMARVTEYDLDGIDIDWEYPGSNANRSPQLSQDQLNQEKEDFADFMVLLKQELGSKRLSFAIGASWAPDFYPKRTFDALDALHLMTYDFNAANHHSNMAQAKATLDKWIASPHIADEKLVLGVPFYGRNASGAEALYSQIIASDPAVRSGLDRADYNGTLFMYDGIPQIIEKTEYAWNKNVGGIMIWETGQDVEVTSPYSLLDTIYQRTQQLKEE